MLRVHILEELNTPTRLPSPPRKLNGRGSSHGLWPLRLMMLPHLCIGVGMAGYLALLMLVAAFGTDTPATVTNVYTAQGYTAKGKKGGTVYYAAYRYSASGHDYTDSSAVAERTYAAVNHPGEIQKGRATVRVRHFELGPFYYHLFIEEASAWESLRSLLFFALFWNGIMSIFVYTAWVVPLRTRWLVRHGVATTGKIVSRRILRGKGTFYYATFRFRESAHGQEFKREMRLPNDDFYEFAEEGRPVTVLYHPRKPKRSVVYELCGYRVEGMDP